MCDSIEDLQFCDDLRSVNRSDAESSGNEPSQSSEQQGEQTAFGDGLKHALHLSLIHISEPTRPY